ncbi:HAD hydrolase-like protein [Shewanella sp. Isolate13]|uniref:HAD family hydrolase n=1 Tax=Shewanella sp. Isolate13 TaxID=2908531 RepID=UPI001EFD2419|nr:HAD hydrolase-like protein [Shewanella sp. Isolate13]MCG9731436.1 HAD hydrolase-like protein [Shewanella sp. Isolate13]
MHPIYDYNLYIFDCDGVILDSNLLKIQAMEKALIALSFDKKEISLCTTYFANNFGKSRFHHVKHFVNNLLKVAGTDKAKIEQAILDDFSKQCKSLYLTAELTPGFIELIKSLPGEKYVASGSEQQELREVFKARGLEQYFADIFGSPTAKATLLANILKEKTNTNAVMVGDAVSDFEASVANEIDFICYIPYSNVASTMQSLSQEHEFTVLMHWPTLPSNNQV